MEQPEYLALFAFTLGEHISGNIQKLFATLLLLIVFFGTFIAISTFGEIDSASALNNSSWSPQASGITKTLNSVYFINNLDGWVVGEDGTILNTKNGGDTWVPQNSGVTNQFNSVFFIDENKGWIIGQDGTILSTTNGGDTWDPQTSGTSYHLHDVYFENENNGWAVGGAISISIICNPSCQINITAWYNTVLRTTNGGASWTKQTNLGRRGLLKDIYFVDSLEGWAVGWNKTILHTTDGGASWSSQTSPVDSDFTGVSFTDANNGWISGYGGLSQNSSSSILYTENGGDSWTMHSDSITKQTYWQGIHTDIDGSVWVIGEGGALIYTEDDGATWTPQNSGVTSNLNGLHFLDNKKGWVVGGDGTILHLVEPAQIYLPFITN